MPKRPLSVIREMYLRLQDTDGNLIKDLAAIKAIAIPFIQTNVVCPIDRDTMVRNTKRIQEVKNIYNYFCNSLLVFEARPYFYRISGCPFVRFNNICNDGKSDWDQKVGNSA